MIGRIQTGSYINREGNKVSTTDVIVEEQVFAGSKSAGDFSAANSRRNTERQSEEDDFMNIPDGICDELPFR